MIEEYKKLGGKEKCVCCNAPLEINLKRFKNDGNYCRECCILADRIFNHLITRRRADKEIALRLQKNG